MTPTELLTHRKAKSKKLKDARVKKGLTIARMMVITGLSRPTISRIENGEKDFSSDTETIYITGLKKAKCRK